MEASTLTATATINNVNVHAAVTPSTTGSVEQASTLTATATINNVNVHAAVTPSTTAGSVEQTAKTSNSLDEE